MEVRRLMARLFTILTPLMSSRSCVKSLNSKYNQYIPFDTGPHFYLEFWV
ncbi:hypothetical protein E2C01_060267 [Portunus trituberculatus]|uniref:Uncharacterized protein n=1 Tax=Portunus trituberculatus TaxID=210409 RepID=A0A5B7H4S2_PORTR|nr:hypothetical protein [Portunus trituberculatus]